MITAEKIQGANQLRTGTVDMNRITALSWSQMSTAQSAYYRALSFNVKTPDQARTAERYAALAAKYCARAGLTYQVPRLERAQVDYVRQRTELSLKL